MVADWVRFCRAKDLTVVEPDVDVRFRDERSHRVTVTDEGDAYLIAVSSSGKPWPPLSLTCRFGRGFGIGRYDWSGSVSTGDDT
jgi:hypothetical protein